MQEQSQKDEKRGGQDPLKADYPWLNLPYAVLCKELNAVIKKSNVTYGDVIRTLKWLLSAYADKGQVLLNKANIQEVALMPQPLHVPKLP